MYKRITQNTSLYFILLFWIVERRKVRRHKIKKNREEIDIYSTAYER
jgi:hypothetical protein